MFILGLTFPFVDEFPDVVVERHCDGNIGLSESVSSTHADMAVDAAGEVCRMTNLSESLVDWHC